MWSALIIFWPYVKYCDAALAFVCSQGWLYQSSFELTKGGPLLPRQKKIKICSSLVNLVSDGCVGCKIVNNSVHSQNNKTSSLPILQACCFFVSVPFGGGSSLSCVAFSPTDSIDIFPHCFYFTMLWVCMCVCVKKTKPKTMWLCVYLFCGMSTGKLKERNCWGNWGEQFSDAALTPCIY